MTKIVGKGVTLAVLLTGVVILTLKSYGQTSPSDSALVRSSLRRGYEFLATMQFDSAKGCFEKALPLTRSLQDLDGQLICLNGIAETLIRRGRFEEGLRVLADAEAIGTPRTTATQLQLAQTDYLLGYVNAYLDKADLSIAWSRKSLEIRQRILGRDHFLVAASLYTLGLGFQKKGAYPDALDCFGEALRIRRTEPEQSHPEIVATMLAIGTVHSAVCEYDSALAYFQQSRQILESSGQGHSETGLACFIYMADAFAEMGQLQESIAFGEKALALSLELNGENHAATAACYGKLGELYVSSGDFERGIEFLHHTLALSLKFLDVNHSGVAWIYRRLSGAFERQNDLGKADEYARRALEIQRRSLGDNHPDVAYSLENVARIEERRGEYPKALTHFNEAIEIRERSEKGAPRNDIARLYAKLGELYTRMKQNRLAFAALERSRDIQNRLSEQNGRLKGATERAFGDLYAQQGALDLALHSYQLSIAALSPGFVDTSISSNPLGPERLDPNGLLESLVGKANVLERRFASAARDVRDLSASLSALVCASEVADRLRKTYVTEGSKLLLEDRINSIYEDGLRTSLRLYKATGDAACKATAFSFVEKSKANVLLDGIRDAEAERFAGIPDSLLARERQLRADITFCETQLSRESGNAPQQQGTVRSNLEKKLFALKETFLKLLADLERQYPAYFAMRFESHAATVEEVQAALDDESCVVEYLVGQHALYIFTISKEGYEVSTRPKPLRLDGLARRFATSIRTIDAAEYLRTGTALYDYILRPIAGQLVGKRRLIVVPDGLLHYVPFEALLSGPAPARPGEDKQTDFTSLPYLVRSYDISYSFSSTFYLDALEQGGGERQLGAGFAGFAPVFRDSVKNGYLLASRHTTTDVTLAGLRSITVDGKRFNELPFSEEEVQAIVMDFEKNGTKSAGYFNRDASEDNFKQNVGKYTYVHIATHGIINEDHPALSSLLFSQPCDSTSGEDGFLYAGEAYGLKLDADLLVLSSCESGVGKLVRGEGLMAMTRGFFYAGARNIIFSLWKVYDDATNRLMVDFYDRVIQGDTFASALRDAKLKMIANPSTAFPCKWGAFVLMGR